MEITIKFFALGRELVGKEQIRYTLHGNSTVADVLEQLKREYPQLAKLNSFLLAVNMDYVEPEFLLKDGDELAIIPPVSGG